MSRGESPRIASARSVEPGPWWRSYQREWLSRDLLAGVTVAVVAYQQWLDDHPAAERLMVKPRSSPETQLPTIEPGCLCPTAHPRVMLGVTQCDPPTTRRRVK